MSVEPRYLISRTEQTKTIDNITVKTDYSRAQLVDIDFVYPLISPPAMSLISGDVGADGKYLTATLRCAVGQARFDQPGRGCSCVWDLPDYTSRNIVAGEALDTGHEL